MRLKAMTNRHVPPLHGRMKALLSILLLMVQLTPCAIVGWGTFLRWTKLSTHDECDMTWMHPTYERINSVHHPVYSLYRYRDARDPRPKSSASHPSRRSAILFVPGHAGSYQQVRSIGTHTIGLTRRNIPAAELGRIKASILSTDLSNTTAEGRPSWDVYSLDFREEPTGLHGMFVEEQSEFVAAAVRFLEQASYRDIVVVAHSLGAYSTLLGVARASRTGGRNELELIRTIVALASPLHHPVISWDWKLRRVHREIANHFASPAKGHPALMSISGGLRDEMIPPHACRTVSIGEPMSMTAVELMKPAIDDGKVPASMGMDHRAIVWCHNLLEPLIELINVLHARESSSEKRSAKERVLRFLQRGGGHAIRGPSYDGTVRHLYAELRHHFGLLRSVAIEASFLYNGEWLISHYSLVALVNWSLLPDHNPQMMLCMPAAEATFAWMFSTAQHLTWWSHLVLACVAHASFRGIWNSLRLLTRRSRGREPSKAGPAVVVTAPLPRLSVAAALALPVLFFVGSVLSTFSAQHGGNLLILYFEVGLVVATFVGVYTLALYIVAGTGINRAPDKRLTVIVAWFLPIIPVLVAGEIAYMCLRSEVNVTFWYTLMPFVYWLTLQYSLRLAWVKSTLRLRPDALVSTAARLVAAIACAYRLFHVLWTREDNCGPPLVYQVLAFVLVAIATFEAGVDNISTPTLLTTNEKRH